MMYMTVGETGAEINFNAIPDDDPFAYAFGFMGGIRGEPREKPQDRHGLASAYKKGFAHGRRVRGTDMKDRKLPGAPEPAPAWAKITWGAVRKP